MLDKMAEHASFVRDVIAGIQALGIVFYNARVAVVRDPEEDMTKGGLFIPEQAKRKEPRGTVVGVGLGVDKGEDTVLAGTEIGDQVMYTKYNPITFNITLPDGRGATLELVHVSDLYIGWRE